jgi:hypothetical protein
MFHSGRFVDRRREQIKNDIGAFRKPIVEGRRPKMAFMIRPPLQFDGKFSDFFEQHVEPNLPPPERIKAFDALLRRHLSSNDPIYLTRYVRGQVRGKICRTTDGGRILPTDNAPVWWLHAFLLSDEPLLADSEALFSGLPCHFHQAARFQTLNQAGFHAAHIVPAKNRNTDWQSWSRDDLARRMLLNIHPCNMFLVAKQEWGRNGGRPDIISWIVDAYRRRYGESMDRFLANCSPYGSRGRPAGDPDYSYGAGTTTVGVIQTKRPLIKRELVGRGVSLEISADGSRYMLPHDDLVDWAREHTTALKTASWIERGVYSWPRPTLAMMEFLRRYPSPSL